MTSSLFSALSGLQAHQSWIDVVGNNLANANTPGFKASRATFADQFARTLRFASGPNGAVGGLNPVQVGLGVQLADVGRNFGQGALTTTGRTFDLALEGRGFFALTNGNITAYTRVGTFGLDAQQRLVDQRTGMQVLGQGGSPIQLDLNELFPPNPTQSLEFTGNLPGVVSGPLTEEMQSSSAFTEGSPANLLGSAVGPFVIPAGSTYTMEIVVNGGAPLTVSIPGGAAPVTTATIVTAIDALDGVSAADVGGAVQITTDRKGESVSLKVNAGSTGSDLASTLGLSTALVSGTEVAASPTTDLNLLPGNMVEYVAGDEIDLVGVDTDGSAVNATFVYGVDGTTISDLVTFMDAQFADAQITLDGNGQILVEAQTAGEAGLVVTLMDGTGAGQVGSTNWNTYALEVTRQGTGPDVVTTSMEVFDSGGTAHVMNFEFERQQDGTWALTPSLDPEDGVVLSPPITGLNFGDDGSPLGFAGIVPDVTVQFNGQSAAQTVVLDLGEDGEFTGLTQFGSDSTVWVSGQDGYGVGSLASVSVDGGGTIQGFYSNGQSRELGSIGIATFSNEEGLQMLGQNLWSETPNSGNRIVGSGQAGGAGRVVSGSLENSNVDTAREFVALIQAQRGFQANARVISTQDEVLAELVNLI